MYSTIYTLVLLHTTWLCLLFKDSKSNIVHTGKEIKQLQKFFFLLYGNRLCVGKHLYILLFMVHHKLWVFISVARIQIENPKYIWPPTNTDDQCSVRAVRGHGVPIMSAVIAYCWHCRHFTAAYVTVVQSVQYKCSTHLMLDRIGPR